MTRSPDFLVIGAQKSGTQWLKHHLGGRADVHVAAGEPGYFTRPPGTASWDDYLACFAGAGPGVAAVGEGTPGYLIWHHQPAAMAARIDEALPGVRLVAVLRHPVERAASALRHHVAWGNLPEGSRLLDTVVTPPGDRHDPPYVAGWGGPQTLVSGGWYGASLAPYVARFGDRLCVRLHDDVVADPLGTFAAVVDHLDLPPGTPPADLAEVRFSTRRPTRRRRLGRRSAPSAEVPAFEVPAEDRAALWHHFADDVAELEVLLGRDLGHWRP